LLHFLRIVRGVLLKGNALADMVSEIAAIALFAFLALAIGLKRFRHTLDSHNAYF
jgi:ABC-2 type transport system permease protein